MKAERIVFDTNVVISAMISPLGKPYACLSWALDNATLIMSREILEEVETRLARPKFAKYVDPAQRQKALADLSLAAVLVELPVLFGHVAIRTTTRFWKPRFSVARIVF